MLAVAPRHAAWLDEHGALARLSHDAAAERLAADGRPPYVCHAKATARRLGLHSLAALDVLELFAFVHPARQAVPTVRGLARALDLTLPASIEDEAATLLKAAEALLAALTAPGLAGADEAPAIARTMARAGWLWGDTVVAALAAGGRTAPGAGRAGDGGALAVWTRLKEWQESAPPPAPGHDPVATAAARQRLALLLGEGAEPRPEQADFASAACAAFDPIEAEEEPHVVLAEAGTGVGKTLGYIAPASLWAERNEGTVWLSTFTRNLQRQIDQELDRLYPEPKVKAEKVVLRKGRENYLCLLNMEEALGRSALVTGDRIALGLMARWAAATRDGDITGGDLPAWLADLLGYGRTLGLADRRGECIHSACTHYRRCFIEKSQRKARRADMVIANHALLMVQAARAVFGTGDERSVPTRYVLDEGHHLFDAADSAFSAHLSGKEALELRRWLLGPESRGRGDAGRARGLRSRIDDLIADREAAREALDDALKAAHALPGTDWHQRLAGGSAQGACERFLALVRSQVMARAPEPRSGYGIEAPVHPLIPGMAEAAAALETALAGIARPLGRLAAALAAHLDAEAESLETAERQRIEAVVRGIERRVGEQLDSWRAMLTDMTAAPARRRGAVAGRRRRRRSRRLRRLVRDLPHRRARCRCRHAPPPRRPDDPLRRVRHGPLPRRAHHLGDPAGRQRRSGARLGRGRGDDGRAPPEGAGDPRRPPLPLRLRRADPRAGGDRREKGHARPGRGGLPRALHGRRRRRVGPLHRDRAAARGARAHRRRAGRSRPFALGPARGPARPDHAGRHLPQRDRRLPARHRCDAGRHRRAGRSLRLIVFDRVPWPRPDILHKARRRVLGGGRYDDRLTRGRLRQAYGRLVRRADDRGVFVLLDPALPSRLTGAFPPGVEVERVGLAGAVEITRTFVGPEA